jgi:hypothetical protein
VIEDYRMRRLRDLKTGSVANGIVHDSFYGIVSELARRTRPRFVQQGIDPTRNEAMAPESHRKSGGLQVASHRRIISPRGASQNDFGTESHGAVRAGLTRNPLQFFTLGVTHDQLPLLGRPRGLAMAY